MINDTLSSKEQIRKVYRIELIAPSLSRLLWKVRDGQNQLQPFVESYTDSTRYKSHKTNFYRVARPNEKRAERIAGEEPGGVE
jgi:hypothetical protein